MEKKLKEAYELCAQILEKYPDQKVFQKLQEKIEEAVEDENEIIIEKKLEETEQLWKEEKYSEILQILKDLQGLSPNNKTLAKEYEKTQKAYLEKIQRLKDEFQKNQENRLEKILNEEPSSLLDELFTLEMDNKGNQQVKNLVTKFKNALIEKKIKEKEQLLNSNKISDIEHFLDDLRKIDKTNATIIKLGQKFQNTKVETISDQQNEFVYGGEKHLDTLMKLKKYDKAIQACKEILAVKKSDSETERILKKAERKLYSQTRNLSVDSIYKNLQSLKEDYKQNKSNYIKI